VLQSIIVVLVTTDVEDISHLANIK
jgi:hypothetical protein